VEGEVGQLIRLDSEILERLGCLVDFLVDKFALDLIGAQSVPPEVLVEKVSGGLQDALGNIDMAAALDDFPVNEFSNLSGRVVLGAVKLEGLAGSGVIVQHALEGRTDVDDLTSVSYPLFGGRIKDTAYVNGPRALLKVVGGEQVGRTGKLVQESVFEAEHRSGSDDCGLRVDRACHFLTPSL
jgi:hypothetical protein